MAVDNSHPLLPTGAFHYTFPLQNFMTSSKITCDIYVITFEVYVITCEIYVITCEIYVITCEIYVITCEIYVITCEIYVITCETYVITCEIHVLMCEIYVISNITSGLFARVFCSHEGNDTIVPLGTQRGVYGNKR